MERKMIVGLCIIVCILGVATILSGLTSMEAGDRLDKLEEFRDYQIGVNDDFLELWNLQNDLNEQFINMFRLLI
ncbi:MAG: hypothetical protein KJ847_02465 [Firmicutes bacterium]|nr:hypothetical protein [Bacillota bacterium]